ERGFATIPLLCFDVPPRSRYLWAGVKLVSLAIADLSKKINPAHLNSVTVIGEYVPNLVAQPFNVSKDDAHHIYYQTHSPLLDQVL
ncbi:hypothetical protein CERSUDRAFT_27263, partial [Gelatoporia subvermispora B]